VVNTCPAKNECQHDCDPLHNPCWHHLQVIEENNTLKSMVWVNVSERLPEQGERAILFSPEYGIFTETEFTQLADWWGVTHWMPLPEPPKDAS
jgi:hypothetical protein